MMSVLPFTALLLVSIFDQGVHGQDTPGGFQQAGENAECEGNQLGTTLRLPMWACAYDCMLNPDCVAFVLKSAPNVEKCFLKTKCDTFTNVTGANTYTKVQQWKSEDGFSPSSENPSCPEDGSYVLQGGAGDAFGCSYACSLDARCVGYTLFDAADVKKRCNVEIPCKAFDGRGTVYSKVPTTACPDGWLLYENINKFCFRIFDKKVKKRVNANSLCANQGSGSQLAILNNKAKMDFIGKAVRDSIGLGKSGVRKFWVAGRYDKSVGKYFWDAEKEMKVKPELLHIGRPNNAQEYFINLAVKTDDTRLNDCFPWRKYDVICMIRLT